MRLANELIVLICHFQITPYGLRLEYTTADALPPVVAGDRVIVHALPVIKPQLIVSARLTGLPNGDTV